MHAQAPLVKQTPGHLPRSSPWPQRVAELPPTPSPPVPFPHLCPGESGHVGTPVMLHHPHGTGEHLVGLEVLLAQHQPDVAACGRGGAAPSAATRHERAAVAESKRERRGRGRGRAEERGASFPCCPSAAHHPAAADSCCGSPPSSRLRLPPSPRGFGCMPSFHRPLTSALMLDTCRTNRMRGFGSLRRARWPTGGSAKQDRTRPADRDIHHEGICHVCRFGCIKRHLPDPECSPRPW